MDELFKRYSDYLAENTITSEHVKFSFWPYDLVDKDLDMNETEYERTLTNFRQALDTYIRKRRLRTCIEEHVMITRQTWDSVVRKIVYEPLEDGRMLRTIIEAI